MTVVKNSNNCNYLSTHCLGYLTKVNKASMILKRTPYATTNVYCLTVFLNLLLYQLFLIFDKALNIQYEIKKFYNKPT